MIDFDRLMGLQLPAVTRSYGPRDAIFYALSVGLGTDHLDRNQLRFVIEGDLRVMPSFAAVLGHVGRWTAHPDAGIDAQHAVHASHDMVFHRPLPDHGTVIARWRVTDIVDKGEGRGAFVHTETDLVDGSSGESLVTIVEAVACRADGGFGGPSRSSPPRSSLSQPGPVPERSPDHVCDLPSLPQTALLYRLNGDDNPLHCDPDYAAAAGFSGPVLHGLATLGFASHALLRTVCDYDPARMRRLSCRFAAPAYPGDSFRTEIWREGEAIRYRTRALERDVIVLSNGYASIAPS